MELDILDAQQMHKDHPTTFYIPSQEDLDKIRVGSVVKICVSNERFWTIVANVDGDKITATVDNDLVGTDEHGLKLEDIVEYEKKNVMCIFEI
jgi:hypothetical protein